MKLTDAKLRTLIALGRHCDGAGPHLELIPAKGTYWLMKYRHGGKEKRRAFGVYPAATLMAAHDAANTLEAVAHAWLAHQSSLWELITLHRITASLETV